MKIFKVLLLLTIGILFVNCGNSNEKPEAKKISGYQIFKKNCRMCHGADGRMGLNGAKPIPESTFTLEERIQHITNGKGSMQAYKNILSKEEIKAVAEYTFKLK